MEDINTNKKGLIPTQDQALQTNKLNTTLIHDIKVVTKKERACMMICGLVCKVLQGWRYKIVVVSLEVEISRLN